MTQKLQPVWLRKFKVILKGVLLIGILAIFFIGLLEAHHIFKTLPESIPLEGSAYASRDVRFLSDVTFTDHKGIRYVQQEIFDEVIALIDNAERLVLMDMFLINDLQSHAPELTRPLSSDVVSALIKRKQEVPGLRAVLITDPINIVYGGIESAQFAALQAAGVDVVVTDLKTLRDPNPLYSALWRPTFGWMGNSHRKGWIKNPFGGEGKVSLRSWLRLLNFKGNHRKVILADNAASDGGWAAIVTSANAHDASSAHGNIAVRFTGKAVEDLFKSELAVIKFSGGPSITVPMDIPYIEDIAGMPMVTIITESKIKGALLGSIQEARKGDKLRLGVFYLSDRDIIWALKDAASIGVDIRVLLDPNFDAFGHNKNGIPNRQSAAELMAAKVPVKWCATHGEQCHAKMLLADYTDGTSRLIAGSANFTRRNLEDYNLETDVLITGPSGIPVFNQARGYYNTVWNNQMGKIYSVPYETNAEDSIAKDYLYRFMEATGISTF